MSMWQGPPNWHLVSADVPPGQVASGKQNWTLVIGGLAAGAYVGTVCKATVTGVGLALGDVLGLVLGDVVATLLDGVPRWDSKMPPPTMSSSSASAAAIPGISQRGRSDSCS